MPEEATGGENIAAAGQRRSPSIYLIDRLDTKILQYIDNIY